MTLLMTTLSFATVEPSVATAAAIVVGVAQKPLMWESIAAVLLLVDIGLVLLYYHKHRFARARAAWRLCCHELRCRRAGALIQRGVATAVSCYYAPLAGMLSAPVRPPVWYLTVWYASLTRCLHGILSVGLGYGSWARARIRARVRIRVRARRFWFIVRRVGLGLLERAYDGHDST